LLNEAAPIRLAGALLIEQKDEWLVSRRFPAEESLAFVFDEPPAERVEVRPLPAA
jgi:hypothetical protein